MPASPTGPSATGRLCPRPNRRGRKVDLGDVDQHALAQRDLGEVGDVAPERHLGIGAAVDIIEQEARQPPLRRDAEIGGRGQGVARSAHRASIGQRLRSFKRPLTRRRLERADQPRHVGDIGRGRDAGDGMVGRIRRGVARVADMGGAEIAGRRRRGPGRDRDCWSRAAGRPPALGVQRCARPPPDRPRGRMLKSEPAAKVLMKKRGSGARPGARNGDREQSPRAASP